MARVAGFMGRRIEYVLEITALEPGRLLAMRSVKSPFPMQVTYEFQEAGEGTRASIRVQGGPGGLYRLVSPLMAWMVKRNVRKDLRRLKAQVETAERGDR